MDKNIYIRSNHDDERLSIIFHGVSFSTPLIVILQLSHRARDTRKLGSRVNVRNSVRILEGAGWTFSILKNFPLSLSLKLSTKRISREPSFRSSFRIHLASFASFELNSSWRKIHGFIVRKNVKGDKAGKSNFSQFLDNERF